MNFGDKLKLLRLEKEWHQPQLAEQLGIEQSFLSKLENGKSLPSKEVFDNVLTAFEITLDDLLLGIDDEFTNTHLRSLPKVANYLKAQNSRGDRRRKIWIVAAASCCVLGFTLLMGGFLLVAFPTVNYDYYSTEIVPIGANGEVFTSSAEYAEYAASPRALELLEADISEDERHKQTALEIQRVLLELANLRFSDYQVSTRYKGRIFTTEINQEDSLSILAAAGISSGATRTYELRLNRDGSQGTQTVRREIRVLSIVGGFLLVCGLLGFATENRLSKIHQQSNTMKYSS